MATNAFKYMSQSDLDSIVAYLRSEPKVASGIEPDSSLTYHAMVMLPLGALPIKDVPDFGPPPYVEPAASVAYGEYFANVFDCALCHGDDLAGGPSGLLPVGPNLAGAKTWTTEQVISTMRTGVTPYGKMLSEDMPRGRPREDGRPDVGSLLAVRETGSAMIANWTACRQSACAVGRRG